MGWGTKKLFEWCWTYETKRAKSNSELRKLFSLRDRRSIGHTVASWKCVVAVAVAVAEEGACPVEPRCRCQCWWRKRVQLDLDAVADADVNAVHCNSQLMLAVCTLI